MRGQAARQAGAGWIEDDHVLLGSACHQRALHRLRTNLDVGKAGDGEVVDEIRRCGLVALDRYDARKTACEAEREEAGAGKELEGARSRSCLTLYGGDERIQQQRIRLRKDEGRALDAVATRGNCEAGATHAGQPELRHAHLPILARRELPLAVLPRRPCSQRLERAIEGRHQDRAACRGADGARVAPAIPHTPLRYHDTRAGAVGVGRGAWRERNLGGHAQPPNSLERIPQDVAPGLELCVVGEMLPRAAAAGAEDRA